MTPEPGLPEFMAVFETFRRDYPHLEMTLEIPNSPLDIVMDVPQQPGLAFALHMNLQNDELHLQAGCFWLEWFPCTQAGVTAKYCEAVRGLLSGRYRILEHYRGKHAVKAELQAPAGDAWETIGTWAKVHFFYWLPESTRVLRNLP